MLLIMLTGQANTSPGQDRVYNTGQVSQLGGVGDSKEKST